MLRPSLLRVRDSLAELDRLQGPPLALATVVALCALKGALFGRRPVSVDELGLYNPIYMLIQYGKMTYPVHGYFDGMYVHPPVHYAEIGLLMKSGLGLYYAEAVPVLFLVLLNLLLICRGGFPMAVKMGLLFGFYSAAALSTDLGASAHSMFGLRPDVHLALAWFAGLVALESGRLDGWSARKLFLGAFLVTYASGIHYFGAPAFAGVIVYALWACGALGVRAALPKLVVMIAGGLAFGLPYLGLFVVPDWNGIRHMTSAVQGQNGLADAVARHFVQYAYTASLLRANLIEMPLTAMAMLPLLDWRVPVLCVAAALLFVPRSTRGLSVASLPLPLFVLLYSQGKSADYYIPEYMLYLSGVGIVVVTASLILTGVILPKRYHWVGAWLVTAVVSVGVAHGSALFSTDGFRFEPRVHEMVTARAAGREIVGPGALVATRLGLWYTAGATHLHCIEPDLLWPSDISRLDVQKYFSRFDAVADLYHMSDATQNGHTLSSWYSDGTLKLKGFYFGSSNSLSYLVFGADAPPHVVGYQLQGDQVFRFDQERNGTYLFITAICPLDRRPELDGLGESALIEILLPKSDAQGMQERVVAFVRPRDDGLPSSISGCRVRDEIPGHLTTVDRAALLAKLATTDETIHFYRTLEEAVAGRHARQELGRMENPGVPLDHKANTNAWSDIAPLCASATGPVQRCGSAIRASGGLVRGRVRVAQ